MYPFPCNLLTHEITQSIHRLTGINMAGFLCRGESQSPSTCAYIQDDLIRKIRKLEKLSFIPIVDIRTVLLHYFRVNVNHCLIRIDPVIRHMIPSVISY